MNKYYLFIIKKEYYNNYKNKSYVLYKVLENLYGLEMYDFSYGIIVFKQLCDTFSPKLLCNYINNRINHEKINDKIIKIKKEKTYVTIKYPCIIIYSSLKRPSILKIFNIYNKNIFMCNFKDNDYMWLNEIIKSRQK